MAWKIELGSAVVYGLVDGSAARDPLDFLSGSTIDDFDDRQLNADDCMVNAFSSYLFDTGTRRVVIDTGFGAHAPDGMDAGYMPAELASVGFDRSDVDHVVFTHLHPDHVLGSLDAEREPFFPNATHWTLQREVDHWRATDDQRAGMVNPVVETLESAGVLHPTEEPTRVVPGVDRFATYGHSPGHTSIRLSSGADELVITGDLTWSPVHMFNPQWTSPFDGDPAEAVATRTRFFDEMKSSGAPFLAGHYEAPGYGRIVTTPDGHRYEALPVTQV